jgi:methylated-DNA-protein-cysteine methyltransferase-like protein
VLVSRWASLSRVGRRGRAGETPAEIEVRDRSRGVAAAEGRLDADAVMPFWAEDAVVHFAGAQPLVGRDAIHKMYATTFPKLKSFRGETAELHVAASGDIAWEMGSHVLDARRAARREGGQRQVPPGLAQGLGRRLAHRRVRGHRQPEPLKTDPILRAVRAIPRGRVATYGQSRTAGGARRPGAPVGYALAALPSGSRVPWHRVVNAAGRISVRSGDRSVEMLQRRMLEREGVRFDVAPARPLRSRGGGRVFAVRRGHQPHRPRALPMASSCILFGNARRRGTSRRANVETRNRGGRMKRWLVAAVSMSVCLSAGLRGEEACKTLQLKNPAPTLAEIYGMAEKAAKAWKADAVPAQISTTSLGRCSRTGRPRRGTSSSTRRRRTRTSRSTSSAAR